MEVPNNTYLPVLRWKDAERIALSQLRSDVRQRMVPIVEFIPREFDIEALASASAIAALRLAQSSGWGPEEPVMLDFHLLGHDIATRVIEFFSDKVKDYRVHAALVTGVFHSRA